MSNLSPLKAIRLKCLDCSGGNAQEVKNCALFECHLFPYRFASNPYTLKRGNPQALAKWRSKKSVSNTTGISPKTAISETPVKELLTVS
ncbi:MAG: hypothetical protein WC364_13725 [Eubacteriales bacterium]|jgi:hypothetical protein